VGGVGARRGGVTSTVYRQVVPGQVQNPETGMSVFTYAVLDAGSQTTCCTPRLVKELGLKVRMQKLHLTTFDGHVAGQKKTTRPHPKNHFG
jgi:hypothetical protein